MDEFTKEELGILFKCIRLAEIDHGECSELDNIRFKIQSIIDNYCDHNWTDGSGNHICCGKCHIIWGKR